MKLSNVFVVKQGDTLPPIQVNLTTPGDFNELVPYNLSAVTATTFTMIDSNGNLTISSASAQVFSASTGTIQYNWSSGDTDKTGKYLAQFQLFFSGGTKITYPDIGQLEINVQKSIGF